MRTIGIDPGLATMGWGVVEEQDGQARMVAVGAVTTPAGMPLPERLHHLYDELCRLIAEHRPHSAAIEELFFGKNVNTALTVGQARGVAMLALVQAHIPVFEYKPTVVKQAIAGYGGADKKQMQEMVRMTLGLSVVPKPDDAADALALALCHIYSSPLLRRLGEA